MPESGDRETAETETSKVTSSVNREGRGKSRKQKSETIKNTKPTVNQTHAHSKDSDT